MVRRGPKKVKGLEVPDIGTWMKYEKDEREEFAKMSVATSLGIITAIMMAHIKDMPTVSISSTSPAVKTSLVSAIFGGAIGPLIGIGMLLGSPEAQSGEGLKKWKAFVETFSDLELTTLTVCSSCIVAGLSYWALSHPEMIAQLPPDSFEFGI